MQWKVRNAVVGISLTVCWAGCSGHSTVEEGDVRYMRTPATNQGLNCSDPQTDLQQMMCEARDRTRRTDGGAPVADECADDPISQTLCSLGINPDELLTGIGQALGEGAATTDTCGGDDPFSQLLCDLGIDLGGLEGILGGDSGVPTWPPDAGGFPWNWDGGLPFDANFGTDAGADAGEPVADGGSDAGMFDGGLDGGPDAGTLDAGGSDAGDTGDADVPDANDSDAEVDAGDTDAGDAGGTADAG